MDNAPLPNFDRLEELMLVFPLVISMLIGLFMIMYEGCWMDDNQYSSFFKIFCIWVLPMWLCYICVAVADTLAIF